MWSAGDELVKRVHGQFDFESEWVDDRRDGFGGFDLFRIDRGQRERVARLVYWDTEGFALETFGGDVPLVVIEELVEEAKRTIRTP